MSGESSNGDPRTKGGPSWRAAHWGSVAWLDQLGRPSTDALHVIERFRRQDLGHMDIQITIDDAKAYTKPWTVTQVVHLLPDTELLEFICNENNRDLEHLPGIKRP